MSDVKPTEVIILSEKIGLAPNAAPEAIVARIYQMQDKIERADALLSEKDHLLARAEDGAKAEAKLKEVEAKLFIERAVANQWIDKKDEAFYVAMFAEHPETVKKHIEDQKFRSFMGRSQAIRDNSNQTAPKSALDAINAMADALVASEKISKSDAHTRVMTENPALSDQYRAEVVMGATGGNR